MVGTWSDVWGRRPFLLTSMCLGSLPLGVLLCHLKFGTSLLFYYPASAAGGAVSIISICLAYIADKLTPCYRCLLHWFCMVTVCSINIICLHAYVSFWRPHSW